MCSSVSPSSALFLSTHNHNRFLLRNLSHISAFRRSRNPRFLCLSASVSDSKLEVSWVSPVENGFQDYGGWAILQTPVQDFNVNPKKGLPTLLLGGLGASFVVLLAAIAQSSVMGKGFEFRFYRPLHALHEKLMHEKSKTSQSKSTESDAVVEQTTVSEGNSEYISDAINGPAVPASVAKVEHVLIPVALDSTQQEALLVLKKLKIIENDAKADQLCTRREYARWLVRANSVLERNPKHRILPSILLSGSTTAAFDDVNVEDPDFGSIQALAEAGVILSKLSTNSGSDLEGSKGQGCDTFSPDRYITRQDLIKWRARLEYKFMPGMREEISRTKVGFMDMKEMWSAVSEELFIDILANEKSILRKVFGQSKRFQPNKPSTRAQAAVALTSGRMVEAIQAELSRIEAENFSRQTEMEEVRIELLDRGEIQRFWDEKLQEEMKHGVEAEREYLAAVEDVEVEKILREKSRSESSKEKAAIDCQRQLLLGLKEEVKDMSERLAFEKANNMTEQHNLQYSLVEIQTKLEGLLDTKSLLEAEKEASRIFRTWVEDEARKSQARAKVLEEVGRRWKWDSHA